MIWKDGRKYLGFWQKGKRSGDGKMFKNLTEIVFEGEWKNDKFDGQGIFYYEKEHKY
jgi:hypothetical protein